MKKYLIALGMISALAVSGCQTTTPMPPPSSVSMKFEGIWKGERFDVSGDTICQVTKISGKVSKGFMSVTLHYNNTLLTGWIEEDGTIHLKDDNPQWDYRFSGKAVGNEIKGDWTVGNAPCKGTWYVKKEN